MSTNHLTPRAELQMRTDNMRVLQRLDVHLRQQPAAEVIPVGEATESSWGALEQAQAEPLRRHNEDPLP